MRIPSQSELMEAILHGRTRELLAACFGQDWYRRGDPRPHLPLTFDEFAAAALHQGIPRSILVEGVWHGHDHFVIVARADEWWVGWAERGQTELRSRHDRLYAARQAVLRELWEYYWSAGNPSHWKDGVAAGTPLSIHPEYRSTRWFRILSVVGVLTLWAMAGVGWMAWRTEGAHGGLVALAPLLAVGGGWLYALASAPYAVHFGLDALTVFRWRGQRRVRYADVRSIRETRLFIKLDTAQGTLRLHKLFANDDARLWDVLEKTVPIARQQRAARRDGGLPIVVYGKLSTALLTGGMGLGILGMGGVAFWQAIAARPGADSLNEASAPPLLLLVMGLLMALVGAFFLYLVLWRYCRRTVFVNRPDQAMTQCFLLRTVRRSMHGVVDFRPGYARRTVRGVPRRLYHITFVYADGATWQWIPDEFDFPLDYVDNRAALRVEDLCARLRRAYASAETPQVDR